MPFHKSVLLASKIILWYYPIAVIKDMRSTKNRDPEAQSSIEALLGEIIDDKNKLEEVRRIDAKIVEIGDSIIKLEEILENPKSPCEIAKIRPTIARLSAVRDRLKTAREIKWSNIQKERRATQKKLDHRVSCMISNEVNKINKQGSKYREDTVDKIAAAGLAAHIYEAIISGDLLDNQPQERNNHDS